MLSIKILSVELSEPKLMERVNSAEDDFAPSWNYSEQLLYFSSNRDKTDKIYSFKENVKLIAGKINTYHKNSSYISFDENNKSVFTSYLPSERQSSPSLFTTKYFKDSWSQGIPISELNEGYFNSQASISKDGNHIVFVSNSGNDQKDTDLFYSKLESNGRWSKPRNIQELNTQDQEITPFLVGSDTLIFASNGKGGKGGFDLFISSKKLGKWQRAIPLTVLNSEFDDSDPCLLPNSKFLFASNRIGGKGGLDIYSSDILKEDELSIDPSNLEIDVTSYITQIRVKSKSTKNLKTYLPYFLYENSEVDLNNKFKKYNGELFDFVANKSKSTIQLIAWTISENESEKELNSKSLADKRLKYLIDELIKNGIKQEKIEIDYSYYKDRDGIPSHIMVLIDNKYPKIKNEETETEVEPKILGFNIDCRPVKELEKINCKIRLNEKLTNINTTIAEVPIETSFNIEKIKEEIRKSDSLVVELEAIDIKSLKSKKTFSYLISKSNEEIKKYDANIYILAEEHLNNYKFNKAVKDLLNHYPENISLSNNLKSFYNIKDLFEFKKSIQLDQFPEKYSIVIE